MMTGRTIAAAVALFTIPIIARFFAPDDFGVAASFVSIVGIVSTVASLRYEAALVLPEQEDEALTLLAFTFQLLVAVCAVMLIFIAIYEMSGMAISVLELLGSWTWFLPLGVFLLASLQIQESWLVRNKSFNLISASLVLGNAVTSGSRIGFGALAGTSAFGLIVGYLLGTACRLLVQGFVNIRSLRDLFRGTDLASMRQIARNYSDFPRLNAPAGFVFALGGNLPVLLFGVMFSPAAAGLYAMANRVAQVPITIVATSMRRVFLQKVAVIANRGRSLRKAFLLTTGGLALAGAVPLAALSMFGEPALGWLLGERWLEAGRYLEIIAPWMFMIWVTAPSNPIFIVLRRQKFWLALQTSLTLLRLGAFGLAYFMAAGPEWTLQAFVAVTVLGNLLTIFIAFMLVSSHSANGPAPVFDDGRMQPGENGQFSE